MSVLKEVTLELTRIKKLRKEIQKYIQNVPEEKLRCKIVRGSFEYYVGNKYQGVEKRDYVRTLASYEYAMKVEKQLIRQQRILEKITKLYEEPIENIYNNLHPARKALVTPIVKSVDDIIENFNQISYKGKPFHEEDITEYYTIKNERVRSKSEKIIADELNRYQIPYKYEMPIELEARNKIVTFYPDFTAINKSTGRKWIIEHFGKMGDASYSAQSMSKLDIYEKNNILLGKNLIIFHESESIPLNVKTVQKYIEYYLC